MSSNHFVKEGQEPALLIVDAVSFELAKGLLEWAPKVIVMGQALETVLTWGIKVDVIITDSASSDSSIDMARNSFPVEIVSIRNASNSISAGLSYVAETGENFIDVVVRDVSDYLAEINAFTSRLNVVIFEPHSRWTFHLSSFEKWVPEGSTFTIHTTREGQEVGISGLKLRNGEYITEKEGIIQFSSFYPFWLVEKQIF